MVYIIYYLTTSVCEESRSSLAGSYASGLSQAAKKFWLGLQSSLDSTESGCTSKLSHMAVGMPHVLKGFVLRVPGPFWLLARSHHQFLVTWTLPRATQYMVTYFI